MRSVTDEQIWLLRFGRDWVNWWELVDNVADIEINDLAERLHYADKLETDRKQLRVRLKETK